MVIYRPGAITLEQIRAVAGAVESFAETAALATEPREALPSPGVGLRHYAPLARLILVSQAEFSLRLKEIAKEFAGERLGVMLPAEFAPPVENFWVIFAWGRWSHPEELAQRLFAGLRELDWRGCALIVCPIPPQDGIGAAIQDRLNKAATPK